MGKDIYISSVLSIPFAELEITASRSGGAGGQHVNKTNSRITLRWNIHQSHAITVEQRSLLVQKLAHELTTEGDLLIHHSSSRSQHDNKEKAIALFVQKLRQGLTKPKKRHKTRIPGQIKEARLHAKKQRSTLKKIRTNFFDE
jgi:ribosome-associated protein